VIAEGEILLEVVVEDAVSLRGSGMVGAIVRFDRGLVWCNYSLGSRGRQYDLEHMFEL